MIPTPPTDPLEDALAHPPHLDDAGFTAGVLAKLPRPGRARALVLAAGVLASAGAAALVVAGPLLPVLAGLSAGRLPSLLQAVTVLVAIAAPLAAAAVAAEDDSLTGTR